MKKQRIGSFRPLRHIRVEVQEHDSDYVSV
jgi:hypothetical protein